MNGGDAIAKDRIPGLYETENVPLEEKTIFQRYEIKSIGFYWLIAELDPKERLAFGYANLNNDDFAEWGYISIDELLENGAELDKEWTICRYKDALNRILNEKYI